MLGRTLGNDSPFRRNKLLLRTLRGGTARYKAADLAALHCGAAQCSSSSSNHLFELPSKKRQVNTVRPLDENPRGNLSLSLFVSYLGEVAQ